MPENQKIRLYNRKKSNAGSRSVSWEFSPGNYPRKVTPLIVLMKRIEKAKRQGLTKDLMNKLLTQWFSSQK